MADQQDTTDLLQTGLGEWSSVAHHQNEADRFGYDPLTADLVEQDINAEELQLASINGISDTVARRLIRHLGDYNTVVEAAKEGVDEHGHDRLVSIPGVSTQAARAIRQSLAGDSE